MDTLEATSIATQKSRNGTRRHKQRKDVDHSRKRILKPSIKRKVPQSSPDRRKTSVKITDLRARYWSYLFENFHRAVDEIYCVCETDESAIECQEMIMMLEVCQKDFEALIKRFEMQREYAKKEGEGRSLAWEVRKSPSKRHGTFESYIAKQQHSDKPTTDHAHVTGQQPLDYSSSSSHDHGFNQGCSWADRVRGYSIPQTETNVQSKVHRNQSNVHGNWSNPAQQTRPNSHIHVVNDSVNDSETKDVETSVIGEKDVQRILKNTIEHDDNTTAVTTGVDDECVDELPVEEPPNINRLQTITTSSDGNTHLINIPPHSGTIATPTNNDTTLSPCNDSPTTPPRDMSHLDFQTTPNSDSKTTPTTKSWNEIMKQYDEERKEGDQLSWADRCESPPLDEEDLGIFSESRDTRSPGRAVQLHQKLSSPLRKKSTEQCIKTLEEKQVKAELFREKKKEEMAQKSKSLSEKIREVQQSRNSITIQKKEAMVERLERAEKLRVSHLQEKIRRAQEEDIKVNEIAFINSLEAQNKKIEVFERHQGVEARLHDMQEERQKKIGENLAKEEAAQERRKALEAERKAKLLELDQRRREQDAKFEQLKQDKEKAREEAAKERERKLEARHAAFMLSTEELEKKIQLKHDSSSKRYGQHLVYKKERAVWGSLSRHSSSDYAPCVEAYQKKKWCLVCNVKIVSEVYLMSHLKGKKHKDSLLANGVTEEEKSDDIIVLAPENIQRQTVSMEVEERIRAGKKRAKKLRQKMSGRTREMEALLCPGTTAVLSKNYQRFTKLIKNINRFLDMDGGFQKNQSSNIEKTLSELTRILGAKNKEDQMLFCQSGGLTSLSRLLLLYSDPSSVSSRALLASLPEKPLLLTLSSLELACTNHSKNSRYMIATSKIVPIIDLTQRFFSQSESCPSLKSSPILVSSPLHVTSHSSHLYLSKPLTNICGSLFNVLAVIMSSLVIDETLGELEILTIKDCISYVVSVGLIDQLAGYFRSVTGPFEEMGTAHLIMSGLNMMLAFIAILHIDVKDVFDPKPQDQTQIISVLRQTELAGILSLLYALLLHNGPPRHSSVPPVLPPYILSITAAGIRAINNSSIVGLSIIQNCLGAEGISLEFRHVLGYLLWYCTYHNHMHLLHELIFAVGYYSVLNNENQLSLLAGRSPTLLQLLCGLPFEYFSDPELEDILYPTLISSCYGVPDSKDVLKLEINCKLLCVYLKTKIEEATVKSAQQDAKSFVLLPNRFPEQYWRSALDFFTDP